MKPEKQKISLENTVNIPKKTPEQRGKDFWKALIPSPSPNDPQGSYTGLPVARNEVPVQDADDL